MDQMPGHYRILSKIGEGGMRVVYRARDEALHRDVAIKVVSGRNALDSSARERLLHEARKSWKKMLEGLPPVFCVKHAVVGEPRAARKPRTAQGRRP